MSKTLKDVLNDANPTTIASAFQSIAIGSVLEQKVVAAKYAVAAVASSYVAATVQVVPVPDTQKALSVLAVYAKAGSGTVGPLAQHTAYPPITNTFAIAPTGDIAVLAADAWTSLDVSYLPLASDIVELTLPVTPGSGLVAIPASYSSLGMLVLLEAESLTGTLTGKMIIDAPGTATATGHARLSASKGAVNFAVADAVTKGRVKFAVVPAKNLTALLASDSSIL